MLKRNLTVLCVLPFLLVSCAALESETERFDPDIELSVVGWNYAEDEYPELLKVLNATADTISILESADRLCLIIDARDAEKLANLENIVLKNSYFSGYSYWVLESSYNDASGILLSQDTNAECVSVAQDYYNGNFTQNLVDSSVSEETPPESNAATELFDRIQQGESQWEVKSGSDASMSLQGILYSPGPDYGQYSCDVWIFDDYSAAKYAAQNDIQGNGRWVSIGQDSKSELAVVVVSDVYYCACLNDVALAGVPITEIYSQP